MTRRPGRPRKPRTLDDYGEVLSTDEVAEVLRKRKEWVRQMVYAGILPSLPGSRIRVPKRALQRWLESGGGIQAPVSATGGR